MLRLFDTATGRVRPLDTREPGVVRMYVCGPTVYGPPHLGHGRFSLVFDVLRRYLRSRGNHVVYVSNITDIDDKIIQRAAAQGCGWQDVTIENEAVWYAAMDALGVERPDHDPHATAYVERMVDLVGQLVDRGAAYVAADGVYFRARSVDDYGLLARQDIDSLVAGARVARDDRKEDPADFALWKLAQAGEPSWPSPWGDGRPGWHTECVVMSLDLLGDGFDLHGGGQDLAFPHHENERAQAVACGRTFAGHWMHNGFVEVAGEKMSKSLGNFTNLVDFIERSDPRSYRMLCLQAHYRSPIDVDESSVAAASAALARLDTLARRLRAAGVEPGAVEPDEVIDRFVERMDDDLDTPGAMAVMFGVVTELNRRLDHDAAVAEIAPLVASWFEMLQAVGLDVGRSDAVPPEMTALLAERDAARAARDFAAADEIRARLAAEGWSVEDGPDGSQLRRV